MKISRLVKVLLFGGALVQFTSCSHKESLVDNTAEQTYFNAWMQSSGYFDDQNNPKIKRIEPGIYVLEETPGTGALLSDPDEYNYVIANYTVRTLDGTVTENTDEDVAKWLLGDNFSELATYGPRLIALVGREENGLLAGVEAAVSNMRVGGKMKFISPGWLNTSSRYDSEKGYLDHCKGVDYIYELEVTEALRKVGTTPDSTLYRWEKSLVEDYVAKNLPGAKKVDGYELYYKQIQAPSDTTSFEPTTKVLVNYTGRLLNGKVFDSTIADTASFHGLGTTDGAVTVTWPSDGESSLSMGESNSSVVTGFAQTILQMKTGEKGIGVFHSSIGYSTSGSGKTILPCTPLVFEIEIVGAIEDDGSL